MITELSIQGLAIIESLSIEFSHGFNVITGETGAGKSILIRALNFLMGAKAGPEAVRKGWEQATVLGEFQVTKGHPAVALLEELGIPADENDGKLTLLIRRTLTAKGRSQSWINDINVTSQPLRALGATLVDVFGQHENQRLMDPAEHTHYLDYFLGSRGTVPLAEVERLSREASAIVGELKGFLDRIASRSKSHDYLSFRLEELKQFDPTLEDFEKVKQFCESAEQQVQVKETLAQAVRALDGSGEEGRATDGLWEASRCLGQLASEVTGPWAELKERAASLARELEDLSFEVGKQLSALDFDESEVEAAQERLFGYQDLFRKHTVRDIEALLSEAGRLREELTSIESATETVNEKIACLEQVGEALARSAEGLTKARFAAAEKIKARIESELHELAMPGAVFGVEFSPVKRPVAELDLSAFGEESAARYRRGAEAIHKIGDTGAERCQFLLATNPGEPILPLTRIASGGELSRIMLALKKSLAADADTCVLVFDEIDTGISGRVADVVGRKMQDLASDFQVICISHLPQVAVYADAHFRVQKQGKSDRTESSIVQLTREESAREIARLLSGAEVSSPSLANARNLIERARAGKPKAHAKPPPKAKPKLKAKPRPEATPV